MAENQVVLTDYLCLTGKKISPAFTGAEKIIPFALFLVYLFFPAGTAAQSAADSLQAVLDSATEDSVIILTSIELSREIHDRDHQSGTEYQHAEHAVNVALELDDALLHARALDNLGLLHRFHQRYAESIPLHIQAYDLIRDMEVDPYYTMRFANNAGTAARYDQMYDLAVQYFLEALKVADEVSDLRNIAISSNGLGNTLSMIPGREEEALEYFFRALETEEERGNTLGMAINYLSVSDYYITTRQFNTAREYLDELLEVNRARDDAFGLAITYEYYGHNYLAEGIDFDSAETSYRRSLESFREMDNQMKQADLLYSLGNVYFERSEPGTALAYYDSSMVLAQEMGNKQLIMNNAEGLSAAHEANANLRGALQYYKMARQYKDSINLIDQETEIAALQRRYNLERQEAEIELLETEKNLQDAELAAREESLKTNRIFLILMGVGLIAILVVSLMQYRNVKIRRKANELLQKREKERLQAVYEKNLAQTEMLAARMQINPHFLFNCLNSIKYLIQKNQSKKATNYLVVFSRFIRMVLESGKNHVISLEEEIELVQYYLKLEENRFDGGFSYQINTPEKVNLDQVLIPPLLLQPYVENAIWHGLLPSRKDEKILRIDVIASGETLDIIIDDNGVGRQARQIPKKAQPSKKKSMGMEITQERIELFNKNYDFDISCSIIDKKDGQGAAGGTKVVIRLAKTEELSPAEP